ncbi:MAG: DUF89 family protein [Oscillospiraceae bacterium]|nr:DUF89 family protein [Oscillospiraceae bacterium]
MSIPMNAQCYLCHLKRNTETARALAGDEAATAFAKGLMQLYLDAPEEKGSPWFGPGVTALLEKHCGLTEDYFKEEKEMSNRFVLQRLEDIRSRILSAEDPLYAALQMAVLGNYIDFSALKGEVSFEKLEQMLKQAESIELDRQNYGKLRADLEKGKKLLYITDNAGEIGFDRLLAEQIAAQYPALQITFCVRGGPASNDATREDAAAVGITFPVIDNDCTVAGTELELLTPEAMQIFEQADVILSKGQANVETLYGCGLNIYYLFLIKCVRFQTYFGKEKLTPMLLTER